MAQKQQQQKRQKTYYDILELDSENHAASVTLTDIKKAYRRLALKYHPDRNPGREEEVTIKFREISDAYQVLSNPDQRREYDQSLKYNREYDPNRQYQRASHGRYTHRDPFAQFNDLFHNDPFFKEAFQNMDDLFAKTFLQTQEDQHIQPRNTNNSNQQQQNKQGWLGWIADQLGVQVQVTTSSTTRNGGTTTSSYQRSSNRNHNNRGAGFSSTYTSKSTRTIIENGRRVTIQSMEQDGNRIEEKYVGQQLVERKINGQVQPQQQLNDGSEF